MVSANLLSAIVLAAATTGPAHAFTSSSPSIGRGTLGPLYVTDDASAQALSDYMAKSHEEKLRAVKDAEDKKNSEIEALKAEIQQLKSSSSLATTTAPAAPLATSDSSEMASKLASYQSFMAEYIVNSQNEKLLAVKEAELKAENKFRERLSQLFEASGVALPGDAVSEPVAAAVEETVFQKRNAQIIAAAGAGKSRWGGMEVQRAKTEMAAAPVAASASAAISAPPEVATTVFEQRNAQVVAAASAGKSRWGSMEVHRAAATANGSPAPAAVVEEKAAAPISLEDRVNLGARLLGV